MTFPLGTRGTTTLVGRDVTVPCLVVRTEDSNGSTYAQNLMPGIDWVRELPTGYVDLTVFSPDGSTYVANSVAPGDWTPDPA